MDGPVAVAHAAADPRLDVAIPSVAAAPSQTFLVQRRPLLDVAFGQHAASFQLLTAKDAPLVVERDAHVGVPRPT